MDGQAHGARYRVQARAFTRRASGVTPVLDFRLGKGLLTPFVLVVPYRIVKGLALLPGKLAAGAHAVGAPAVLAVVREQPRVQFGIRGRAGRAGTQRRKHAMLADAGGGAAA